MEYEGPPILETCKAKKALMGRWRLASPSCLIVNCYPAVRLTKTETSGVDAPQVSAPFTVTIVVDSMDSSCFQTFGQNLNDMDGWPFVTAEKW